VSTFELKEFSVVLRGGFSPLQMNSEYLFSNGIVSSHYTLSSTPICDKNLSQLEYDKRIIISTTPDTINFVTALLSKENDLCDIIDISSRFIEKNPQSYRAVGLNPKGHYETDSDKNTFKMIKNWFFKEADWMNEGTKPIIPEIGLTISYSDYLLILKVFAAKFEKDKEYIGSVVVFTGNFHHEIIESCVKTKTEKVRNILNGYHLIIQKFEDLIQNKILRSVGEENE